MDTVGSEIRLNSSGQISIIPKPELRGFGGDSLTKPPFKVTSAEVVIICPEQLSLLVYPFIYKILYIPRLLQSSTKRVNFWETISRTPMFTVAIENSSSKDLLSFHKL